MKVSGGRQGGSARIKVLAFVAPCELLSDQSATDLVTLVDKRPSRPHDFALRVALGAHAGHPVPDMHFGHELHFFVASFLDLYGVKSFPSGTVQDVPQCSRHACTLVMRVLLPTLSGNRLPCRGILFAHVFKLDLKESVLGSRLEVGVFQGL